MYIYKWGFLNLATALVSKFPLLIVSWILCDFHFNPLALELDIYILAHYLCKMWIFYEPRRVTLGNSGHFVEEETKMVRESLKEIMKYICWLNI